MVFNIAAKYCFKVKGCCCGCPLADGVRYFGIANLILALVFFGFDFISGITAIGVLSSAMNILTGICEVTGAGPRDLLKLNIAFMGIIGFILMGVAGIIEAVLWIDLEADGVVIFLAMYIFIWSTWGLFVPLYHMAVLSSYCDNIEKGIFPAAIHPQVIQVVGAVAVDPNVAMVQVPMVPMPMQPGMQQVPMQQQVPAGVAVPMQPMQQQPVQAAVAPPPKTL